MRPPGRCRRTPFSFQLQIIFFPSPESSVWYSRSPRFGLIWSVIKYKCLFLPSEQADRIRWIWTLIRKKSYFRFKHLFDLVNNPPYHQPSAFTISMNWKTSLFELELSRLQKTYQLQFNLVNKYYLKYHHFCLIEALNQRCTEPRMWNLIQTI